MLAGRLPFPISQNEDLKVSDDGKRAVIANDGSLPYSPNMVTNGVHIVDTTDVTMPKFIGSTSARVRGTGTDAGTAEHTVVCADPACQWIYGSSGNIYDARNPADIKTVARKWNLDRAGKATSSKHALNRDVTGLLVSDPTPRLVLDVTGKFDPRSSYANPITISEGRATAADPKLQHNNVRVDAAAWKPRDPGNAADALELRPVTPNPRSVSATNQRPVLRAGELLIGSSESNINPTCSSAGGLSTWSMANFDRGAQMQLLERLVLDHRLRRLHGGRDPRHRHPVVRPRRAGALAGRADRELGCVGCDGLRRLWPGRRPQRARPARAPLLSARGQLTN